ncbi:hypothetical protein VPH35_103943 [Triticum aestivum]
MSLRRLVICCGEACHRCSGAACGGSPHLPISCPWWMEVDEGGSGDSFIISSFGFGSEDHWSCFFLLPLLMRWWKGRESLGNFYRHRCSLVIFIYLSISTFVVGAEDQTMDFLQ